MPDPLFDRSLHCHGGSFGWKFLVRLGREIVERSKSVLKLALRMRT